MKSRRMDTAGSEQINLSKKLQKVQGKLDEMYKEIEDMTFMGVSGGGVVEVMLKGDKSPVSIKIKKESEKELKNDFPMLIDLIIAAFNDGIKKVDDYTDKEISKVTKGIPLPGIN